MLVAGCVPLLVCLPRVRRCSQLLCPRAAAPPRALHGDGGAGAPGARGIIMRLGAHRPPQQQQLWQRRQAARVPPPSSMLHLQLRQRTDRQRQWSQLPRPRRRCGGRPPGAVFPRGARHGTGLGAARRNFSKEDQQGGAFFQGVEGRLRNPETGTHPAVLLLTDQGYTQARVGQNVREVLGDGLDAELVRKSKLIVRGSRSYHRVGDICEEIEDPATRERLFYAKSTCYARGGVASCRASEDAKVTWGRHPGRKGRPT